MQAALTTGRQVSYIPAGLDHTHAYRPQQFSNTLTFKIYYTDLKACRCIAIKTQIYSQSSSLPRQPFSSFSLKLTLSHLRLSILCQFSLCLPFPNCALNSLFTTQKHVVYLFLTTHLSVCPTPLSQVLTLR